MKKKHDTLLIKVCANMCNTMSMCYDYESWTETFKKKETKNKIEEIKTYLQKEHFDIYKCSVELLLTVGFKWWDEEKTILLIPLWAALILDEGLDVVDIFGDHYMLVEVAHDVRFGCIACGLNMKRNR